jgi:hypothetical protein
MPRIARLKVKGEPALYHVMSRTALDGFVLGDVEKDYLLKLIQKLSKEKSSLIIFSFLVNLSLFIYWNLFIRRSLWLPLSKEIQSISQK